MQFFKCNATDERTLKTNSCNFYKTQSVSAKIVNRKSLFTEIMCDTAHYKTIDVKEK